VEEAKRLLKDGVRPKEVARVMGRTPGAVYLRRYHWIKNKELVLQPALSQ
jgi:hypothetical protein